MRVLLAGGTGVIGRSAVPLLLAAGHDLTVVSRREDTDRWLRGAGARPLRLDVFDAAAVRDAADGVEAVINLATHIPPAPRAVLLRAWATNDRLRRDASRALATAAVATGARFIQESFAPTYPDRGARWITEAEPLAPVAQTRTVPDAEASAAMVSDRGGTGVVLRFGLFYGGAASGDWLAYARRGRLVLPGPGDRYTSMIHIDDAAAAVVAALTLPAGTYNVVDDEPLTRADHAAVAAAAVGRRVRPLPAVAGRMPVLTALARSQRISNARLRDAAGWAPSAPSAREGWRMMVEQAP